MAKREPGGDESPDKRTYEKPMHLDMPFAEALERFIGVDPKEVAANLEKSKEAKPPADHELQKAGEPDAQNVTKLRDKRKPKNIRKLLGR